ncbi:hypothetical protein COCSUDRAFT_47023 [Coccomyxa subellipsoidea C-169]|uniref:Uncharacterized protein n=1 Tax=Coccomyxa subellipsoidea (strain C-169) TaxID=574566 RepID=I0YZL3_COCSC|nr:hypothetical protein COCSUDRAFT_47023 [Coccomyxa subellipsoidea C-169]EIE23832.1 hypothetical protein COCSUDRAFT_47023 [Coccomyxa subellipsoidea C-169]|eukprot:XP_005648376.1 hypothetical protein COCSUDRAFT_47023 [Coccomyxa subellipsoidea C-169]
MSLPLAPPATRPKHSKRSPLSAQTRQQRPRRRRRASAVMMSALTQALRRSRRRTAGRA